MKSSNSYNNKLVSFFYVWSSLGERHNSLLRATQADWFPFRAKIPDQTALKLFLLFHGSAEVNRVKLEEANS